MGHKRLRGALKWKLSDTSEFSATNERCNSAAVYGAVLWCLVGGINDDDGTWLVRPILLYINLTLAKRGQGIIIQTTMKSFGGNGRLSKELERITKWNLWFLL